MIFEPNDVIANASNSNISSDGLRNTTISSDIADDSDVDIYRFQPHI